MTSDLITKLRALITPDENGLLRCPFCYGQSRLVDYENDDEPYLDGYYGQCAKCSVQDDGLFTLQGAISAWNTRAYIPLIEEAIKELEAKDGSN